MNNLRAKQWTNFDTLTLEQKISKVRDNIYHSAKPLTKLIQVKMSKKLTKWFDYELKQLRKKN